MCTHTCAHTNTCMCTHAHVHTHRYIHTHTQRCTDYTKLALHTVSMDNKQTWGRGRQQHRSENMAGVLSWKKKCLEVWFESIQTGVILKRKGRVPSLHPHNFKLFFITHIELLRTGTVKNIHYEKLGSLNLKTTMCQIKISLLLTDDMGLRWGGEGGGINMTMKNKQSWCVTQFIVGGEAVTFALVPVHNAHQASRLEVTHSHLLQRFMAVLIEVGSIVTHSNGVKSAKWEVGSSYIQLSVFWHPSVNCERLYKIPVNPNSARGKLTWVFYLSDHFPGPVHLWYYHYDRQTPGDQMALPGEHSPEFSTCQAIDKTQSICITSTATETPGHQTAPPEEHSPEFPTCQITAQGQSICGASTTTDKHQVIRPIYCKNTHLSFPPVR